MIMLMSKEKDENIRKKTMINNYKEKGKEGRKITDRR